ncbi:metallophosphoesterase [Marinobacter persicus]|uniref:Serine/threonine protein phosphatase 1 n=1 Tax=Marinobacter persicus TaxID=930118 RepID=A0A2S6G2A1_9GAMM|nr:metallophosphoesterase [Marinobacter persicus]PPK49912.1 serine/threonine protein phosphatase 1 [Marinobacter persicus]PPK51588.1 serine/threonine protein phosphatase 1 [Marinobacter persicus]PPK56035.1 serine/threonine protein phosphatase 1 [Marinobacter persicus]
MKLVTHQTIAPNPAGIDWVCGDVHGHLSMLQEQLKQAGFRFGMDRLFLLGDLIDRGPDSEATLNWALSTEGVFSVLGNHELMFLARSEHEAYRVKHRLIGGAWADDLSFGAYRRLSERCAREFPLSMTVPCGQHTVGLVHAQSPFDDWRQLQDADYSEKLAIDCTWPWDRAQGPEQVIAGVSAVMSGHIGTPEVVTRGNQIWIDTVEATGEFTLAPIEEIFTQTSSKFGRFEVSAP